LGSSKDFLEVKTELWKANFAAGFRSSQVVPPSSNPTPAADSDLFSWLGYKAIAFCTLDVAAPSLIQSFRGIYLDLILKSTRSSSSDYNKHRMACQGFVLASPQISRHTSDDRDIHTFDSVRGFVIICGFAEGVCCLRFRGGMNF
jgi:hypothetical protein